jgi:small multidrug resistance pump
MSWVYLFVAIISEVTGTTFVKLSHGFTRLAPSVFIFVFYSISLAASSMALKKIDISVAYVAWSGLGTALIVVIGAMVFKEPLSAMKIFYIALIMVGVVGLNMSGAGR